MGRHCVANDKMTKNTGLEEACVRANNTNQYKNAIKKLWSKEITETELEQRTKVLNHGFDNEANVMPLIEEMLGIKLKSKTSVG
jgi:hypothetical protein